MVALRPSFAVSCMGFDVYLLPDFPTFIWVPASTKASRLELWLTVFKGHLTSTAFGRPAACRSYKGCKVRHGDTAKRSSLHVELEGQANAKQFKKKCAGRNAHKLAILSSHINCLRQPCTKTSQSAGRVSSLYF